MTTTADRELLIETMIDHMTVDVDIDDGGWYYTVYCDGLPTVDSRKQNEFYFYRNNAYEAGVGMAWELSENVHNS
jgi:hypothetical protein